VLLAAHAEAARRGLSVTDDSALVELLGGNVVVVRSDRWNLKVTEPADLHVVRALLAAGSSGRSR
jgi:2-C-methyl-D-erythritol 4-phosphate cytidylyltransferase